MGTKSAGLGFYEFLIEAELQQYYSPFKNELKVQNVSQLKYVSEEDMAGIGMSRPEIRRLIKFFHKHCPQTYLAKMKKKLLYRRDDSINSASLSSNSFVNPARSLRSVAPGRHIIQADAIVSHKTLGSGEFGTVQQGVWTSDDGERIQVAIKCLSQDRMENNPVEFLKEAAIMHSVDHEQIVRLYGVVLDTSSLVLVTELAPLRSLLECLKEPSMRPNLTVQTLFDFSIQICDGMQYLESKRLIHRDLAARNILVFSRSKVKISDFGLSRALGVGKDYYQTNFNVNLKLPIAWCAPECINFLRFTSSSDVWAFGVTLWEMFSYGFQPWAALTGQQILEAIDEPNYQRLERPESCPVEIYYQVMLKCWQHLPSDRPTFAQLLNLLPENKPEQVQAIRESDCRSRRDVLSFDAGDLITVIDKQPTQGPAGSGNSGDEASLNWKGVLKCGKTGLFNPAHTITYLGPGLPCVKENQGPFNRNDSRSSSMRKGRLSADMISSPQGDLKHTGHVGPDGQFFGDIAFMNSKCWVPRQVVPPYKPESPISREDASGCSSPGSRFQFSLGKGQPDAHSEIMSNDTAPLLSQSQKSSESSLPKNRRKLVLPTNGHNGLSLPPIGMEGDHEYHEISDEENEIMARSMASGHEAIGLSNPALSSKSQSPLDSPRFEKTFELGPSLMDEVFGALEQEHHHNNAFADHESNVKNELREMSRHKKKFATVKPISSKDRKTLDHAIQITQELASRSMLELDRHGKHGRNSASFDDISSTRTPTSPTHRKKFSFLLGSNKNIEREQRNYAQEAASIPDIQSTLSDEAKEAYNSLIEKPSSIGSLGFLTPSFENKSSSFHFPEKCSSKKSAFFDNEPLSPPPPASSFTTPAATTVSIPGNSSATATISTRSPGFVRSHTKSLSCTGADLAITGVQTEMEPEEEEEEEDGNPLRLLRKNKVPNVLPLPPRDRRKFTSSRSFDGTSSASTSTNPASTLPLKINQNPLNASTSTRHQRKHPLLIPAKVAMPLHEPQNTGAEASRVPPPPPPKPQRQHLPSSSPSKQIAQPEIPRGTPQPEINENEGSSGSTLLPETGDIIPSGELNPTTMIPTPSVTKENDEIQKSLVENVESAPPSSTILSLSPPHVPMLYENYEDKQISNGDDSFNTNQPKIAPPPPPERCWDADTSPEMDLPSVDVKERRHHFEKEVNENGTAEVEKNGRDSQFNMRRTAEIQSSRKQSTEVTRERMDCETKEKHEGVTETDFPTPTLPKLTSKRSSDSQRKSEDRQIPAPQTETVTIRSEKKGGFRCSPTKDAILYANPLKIKTVQRILGSSATEKECIWALDICRDDCAHAVKLLRLKTLLPESLLQHDIERVISVLEMSHWDVARASDFLLSPISQSSKTRNSLRKFPSTTATAVKSPSDDDGNSNIGSRSNKVSLENGNSIRNSTTTNMSMSSGSVTSTSDGSLDMVNSNTPPQRHSNGRRSSGSSEGPSSSSPSYIRPTRV